MLLNLILLYLILIITTSHISKLSLPLTKEILKNPDEIGRFRVLGIYQKSITRKNKEKLKNETFVDNIIKIGGEINPSFNFDHIHRNLILVAYQNIDRK